MNNNISILNIPTLIVISNTSRKNLIIENTGTETVYLGGDVLLLTTNGYPLLAGETFKCNDYNGSWYGIATTGPNTINYFEES